MSLSVNPQINVEGMDSIIDIFRVHRDTQLLILVLKDKINFLGKVSTENKQLIRSAIKQNEYYEMDQNVFKITLNNKIYLFKKFGNSEKGVLFGVIVEKTNANRVELIDKQVKHLLKKSEKW